MKRSREFIGDNINSDVNYENCDVNYNNSDVNSDTDHAANMLYNIKKIKSKDRDYVVAFVQKYLEFGKDNLGEFVSIHRMYDLFKRQYGHVMASTDFFKILKLILGKKNYRQISRIPIAINNSSKQILGYSVALREDLDDNDNDSFDDPIGRLSDLYNLDDDSKVVDNFKLREQVKQLEDELITKNEQYKELESEIDVKDEEIEEIEEICDLKIKQLEGELAEKTQRCKELEEDIDMKRKEMVQLECDVDMKCKEIKQLQLQLESDNDNDNNDNDSDKSLKECQQCPRCPEKEIQLKQLEQDHSKLMSLVKTRVPCLKREMQALVDKNVELKKQLDDMFKRNNELVTINTGFSAKTLECMTIYSQMSERNNELASKYNDLLIKNSNIQDKFLSTKNSNINSGNINNSNINKI